VLYSIFCYHAETSVGALTQQEDDALMENLTALNDALRAEGKLGPVARLGATDGAITLRVRGEPMVVDGPFAETKEALLGFYLVDCATREDAIDVARRLVAPRVAAGLDSFALEIRPVRYFHPGISLK
jgi:hypothetical protein